MKLSEAKKIVGYVIEWQFVLMGVKARNDLKEIIDLSKYSLADLIKANSIVDKHNSNKRRIQQKNAENGIKSKPISIQMTLADRLIAAVYVALNFEANGQMQVLINDVAVACVKPKY